ncbi:hypothetical protein [Glaciimonas sp. PAMC28666]|uniref:hypothetical protein n=1 Tax=Glaciimonas sp. PAMC28666 TaxID=2807626 RepID=UPI001964A806|nr:hypothetical protein [Glaciimonas sp. PAMC28666]QRX80894.1 hypothetical protein JQN73_11715 [Glaciimonas sp. PAMC28666]
MTIQNGFYGDTTSAVTGEVGEDKVLHEILSSAKMLTLTEEEIELIARFRTLDSHAKAQAFDCVGGVAPVDLGVHIVVYGEVGQQVMGNVTGPQTFNMGGK